MQKRKEDYLVTFVNETFKLLYFPELIYLPSLFFSRIRDHLGISFFPWIDSNASSYLSELLVFSSSYISMQLLRI